MKPDIADIWNWLDQVPDPEIPVISIVDLGIVRKLAWVDDTLEVSLTPTYTGCPATRVIEQDVKKELHDRGIGKVRLLSQIAPPWTTDWLSEKGRAKLQEYGIAPPQTTGVPDQCPRCANKAVTRISQFGSTPCKAQWRCDSCLEPFDYFKCI